jgi:hypothetical protein
MGVDLAYVDHLLVIEADSRRWHTQADAFLTDRERDNLAQLAGWRGHAFHLVGRRSATGVRGPDDTKGADAMNAMQGVTYR